MPDLGLDMDFLNDCLALCGSTVFACALVIVCAELLVYGAVGALRLIKI